MVFYTGLSGWLRFWVGPMLSGLWLRLGVIGAAVMAFVVAMMRARQSGAATERVAQQRETIKASEARAKSDDVVARKPEAEQVAELSKWER
jgi:beta-lactamase regulating signal transducer with metallopeptidase domain